MSNVSKNKPPSAPVGMEDLKKRAWELLEAEYERDFFAGNYEDAAIDAIAAALAQQPAAEAQPDEWVLVPRDAIERAIETLENDGDEHGEGRNLRAMLDAAQQGGNKA